MSKLESLLLELEERKKNTSEIARKNHDDFVLHQIVYNSCAIENSSLELDETIEALKNHTKMDDKD